MPRAEPKCLVGAESREVVLEVHKEVGQQSFLRSADQFALEDSGESASRSG